MKKVLIIDDDPGVHSIVSILVQGRLNGCSLLDAYNGEDGIALAASELPDVILLDVGMPGIDGFETCRSGRRVLCPRVRCGHSPGQAHQERPPHREAPVGARALSSGCRPENPGYRYQASGP